MRKKPTFKMKVAALERKYSKRTRFDYYNDKAIRELWLFIKGAKEFLFTMPKRKSDRIYKLMMLIILATPISLWALAILVLILRLIY